MKKNVDREIAVWKKLHDDAAMIAMPPYLVEEGKPFPNADKTLRGLAVALAKGIKSFCFEMEMGDGTRWKLGLNPLDDDLPAHAYAHYHNFERLDLLLQTAMRTIMARKFDDEVKDSPKKGAAK